MSTIIYTVTVFIQYRSVEEDWLAWMKNEHIPAIKQAGATEALLIHRDPENENDIGITYDIQYKFDDRGKFETYIEQHAPALRRESYEKFPLTDGFKYSRTSGIVIETL